MTARRATRWLLLGLVALLLLAAVVWSAVRTPDIPAAELASRYANAESEFVTIAPGLRVHLRDEGPVDAPAIMLLHGSSASLHTWEPWVARLKDRYRVISYDQPGHGLTGPHPQDRYDAAAFVDVVDRIAQNRNLDKFVLAGNSMGGWVAWNYALAHPDKLVGLVLVDASGPKLPPGIEPKLPIGFRLARTPVLRDFLREITPRSMVEKSLRQSVSVQSSVTPAVVDRYWSLLHYPGNRRATSLRFATPRNEASPQALAGITMPTLIIWGREDRLVPVEAAAVYDRYIPNSRAIIYDGVGHIPMEEAPDRSAADLRAFMATLPGPQSTPPS